MKTETINIDVKSTGKYLLILISPIVAPAWLFYKALFKIKSFKIVVEYE